MSTATQTNGASPPMGVIAPPHNLDAEQSVLGATCCLTARYMRW